MNDNIPDNPEDLKGDYLRDEMLDRQWEERQAERIPTPETDKWTGLRHDIRKLSNTSRDLERRLTVAREALRKASDTLYTKGQASVQEILCDALIQTAPKP